VESLGAVFYGLMASLLWGTGDYSGGVASKRMSAVGVVALSHVIGLGLMIVVAIASREALPQQSDIVWGAASGLAGAVGLAALYQALAVGKAGVAAPITSVVAASLPVGWSLLYAGLPGILVIIGIALGLVSVVLVSGGDIRSGDTRTAQLAFISGLGFGGFYILVAQFSDGAVFYPLVAARCASAVATLALVMAMRQSLTPPNRLTWIALTLAGSLDIGANIFYALSTQAGRLDEAVIVSSLYPAVTILLAFIIRRERITPLQGVGILAGLAAVACISIG
jgi:drug/metabolite transporter (DMT)-like permease